MRHDYPPDHPFHGIEVPPYPHQFPRTIDREACWVPEYSGTWIDYQGTPWVVRPHQPCQREVS